MADTPPETTALHNKRLLIVEDEVFLRELYVQVFKEAGYQVDEAADGEEAENKMRAGGYDLVLLDIGLPKKDGLQVLRSLQSDHPKKANKSVVVLTNYGEEAVISEGVSLDIRGHLMKSDHTPDQLLAEVARFTKS